MCLYVEKIPEDLKPLTAEKDIHVYKVLKHRKHNNKRLNIDRIFTPYMETPITFNLFGKCVMEANMDGIYRKEGINYANNLPKFIDYEIVWENGEILRNSPSHPEHTFDKGVYLSINAGIHAYITRGDARYQSNFGTAGVHEKLHKAVIPKGAHYFIGTGNEIVADKMIIYRKTVKCK